MLAKMEYLIGLKQLIKKEKKKVDRSDYGWWLGLQFNFMALFGRLHCTFR